MGTDGRRKPVSPRASGRVIFKRTPCRKNRLELAFIPNCNSRALFLFSTFRVTKLIPQLPLDVSFGLMLNALVTV